MTLLRRAWGRDERGWRFGYLRPRATRWMLVPRKVEWSDERLSPVSTALAARLAPHDTMLYPLHPHYLQRYDVLQIGRECVWVRACLGDRARIARAVGGTPLGDHETGALVSILGPALPETPWGEPWPA